jgi:hypothetical protein
MLFMRTVVRLRMRQSRPNTSPGDIPKMRIANNRPATYFFQDRKARTSRFGSHIERLFGSLSDRDFSSRPISESFKQPIDPHAFDLDHCPVDLYVVGNGGRMFRPTVTIIDHYSRAIIGWTRTGSYS